MTIIIAAAWRGATMATFRAIISALGPVIYVGTIFVVTTIVVLKPRTLIIVIGVLVECAAAIL